MQPARLGADLLGHRRGEGDDVVLHLRFDLVDTRDLERGTFLFDGARGGLRNNAGFGERLAGGNLNLQPAAEFIFVTPNRAHLRACITSDQGELRLSGLKFTL